MDTKYNIIKKLHCIIIAILIVLCSRQEFSYEIVSSYLTNKTHSTSYMGPPGIYKYVSFLSYTKLQKSSQKFLWNY